MKTGKAVILAAIVLILAPLVFAAPRVIHQTYHSKTEMISAWNALCSEHPGQCSSESVGKSLQGRDIMLYKIGNPSGGRVMVIGSIHGPEDSGTELSLVFSRWLLTSGEDRAKRVLSRNYLLIIPIVNMDTNARQNMRRSYTLEDGRVVKTPYGVDLNRNFPYDWGSKGSGDPNDAYEYRGAWAGSEPETKAVVNALKKYPPKAFVDVHVGDKEYLVYRGKSESLNMKIKELVVNFTRAAKQPQYSIFGGAGRGGYAQGQAYAYNASAWLLETGPWEDLPADYEEFKRKYYPRVRPILLGMLEAVEVKPAASAPPAACEPSWVLNDTWGSCTDKDVQYAQYYDANKCGVDISRPPPAARVCDFCIPTWEASYGSCQPDGVRTVTYSYTNTCCSDTGLKSDCSKPSSTTETCEAELSDAPKRSSSGGGGSSRSSRSSLSIPASVPSAISNASKALLPNASPQAVREPVRKAEGNYSLKTARVNIRSSFSDKVNDSLDAGKAVVERFESTGMATFKTVENVKKKTTLKALGVVAALSLAGVFLYFKMRR